MLTKKVIQKLIEDKKLIEGYIDLKKQITPNGFDVTVESIWQFEAPGAVDFSNKERSIGKTRELISQKRKPDDSHGWWTLQRGAYKIRTNEAVNLPKHIVALAFSRTSLLRVGAFTQHGVWDAGFCGKGEFVLVVENPFGIELKQNARIAQLVFFGVEETEAYSGIYKNLK